MEVNAAVTVEATDDSFFLRLASALATILSTSLTTEEESTLERILRFWREDACIEAIQLSRELIGQVGTDDSNTAPAGSRSVAPDAWMERMGQAPGGQLLVQWVAGVSVRAAYAPEALSAKEEQEMIRQTDARTADMSTLEPELAQSTEKRNALKRRKYEIELSLTKNQSVLTEKKKLIEEVEGR